MGLNRLRWLLVTWGLSNVCGFSGQVEKGRKKRLRKEEQRGKQETLAGRQVYVERCKAGARPKGPLYEADRLPFLRQPLARTDGLVDTAWGRCQPPSPPAWSSEQSV